MEEDILLKKRLEELATKAYQQNIYTHTPFLSEAQLDIYYQMKRELSFVDGHVDGGHEFFRRGIVVFGSEEMFGYQGEDFLTVVKISPVFKKFSETLSHRDYLGAMMNLGVDRSQLGDLLITEDGAYVFCFPRMVEFFKEHLNKVRHTQVEVTEISWEEIDYKQQFEEKTGFVPSFRVDVIVAFAFGLSRSASMSLGKNQKVFVNGRLEERSARVLKNEDIVSVRGYGKFIFKETGGVSKKGRKHIVISLFK